MNNERIHSMEQLEQRILFDGMVYDVGRKRIIPLSDIDAIMDARGKAWILYECKRNASLPFRGQRMLISRLIDDLGASGKPACAMICAHGEGMYLKDSIVTAMYMTRTGWKRLGIDYSGRFTAREMTDRFLKKYAPEMLGGASPET